MKPSSAFSSSVPLDDLRSDHRSGGEDSVGMRRRRGVSKESGEMTTDGGGKKSKVGGGGGLMEGAVLLEEALEESLRGIEVSASRGFDFDLNEPADYLGVGESVRNCINDVGETEGKEVICIESDSDSDVQILNEGKFYACGGKSASKADFGRDLNLGMVDVGSLGEGSSSIQRRYTREEKGKSILDGDWLSIAIENHRIAYSEKEETDGTGGGDILFGEEMGRNEFLDAVNEQFEDGLVSDVNGIHFDASILPPQLNMEPPINTNGTAAANVDNTALLNVRIHANSRRAERRRYKEVAQFYAKNISHLQQLSTADTPRHEIQEISGPFSMAMQKLLDHNQEKHWPRNQQRPFSIDWTPSRGQGCKLRTAKIPSLLDLSLTVLAKNVESIVSLQPIPDALKRRISQAACDRRKMDSGLLELLVAESPTEVYVKDCSWMTEEQFVHIFASFDTKNLLVLQLDLCGQALTEYTLGTALAKSEYGLSALANLSLKSACRLTDNALALIVESAPSLQSINLSQCSLLTSYGISKLATSLVSTLKELYVNDCPNIDAMDMLPALAKFERLEVLSVSGIHSVSDEFVCLFISFHGSKLKEIGLADCQKLTDSSLKAIGKGCPGLYALDISNLDQLTDATVEYIANGCRSIQILKCCRNSFSDEAVASFLEVSGQSLIELSLNHISKVGTYTALSLAKHSRNLLNLDLSWCRKLTDAAVGLIADSCLSLRLLKLFGCTQITEVFLNGHSNPNVEIIGSNNMPVLKQLTAADTHPSPLRYSPLETSKLT